MNFKIIIIVLLLPYSLFAQTQERYDLPRTSYIPCEDPSMFCLIGNSLCIRDQTKDSVVFDELLQFPNLDVEIRKGTSKKVLDSSEKKALAIALLRLSVKSPPYFYGIDDMLDSIKSTKGEEGLYINYIAKYELCVNGFVYTINLNHKYCIVNITSDKELKKNNSFLFSEGTYISKEFYELINLFFNNKRSNSDSSYGNILKSMSSYSKNELVDIFEFATNLVKKNARLAVVTYDITDSRDLIPKFFRPLSSCERKSISLSLIRSLFITDYLISKKIDSEGNLFQTYVPLKRKCFYIQYDNKNVLSLEYSPNLLFYANVPACVLLKNLEIKDDKIYETESNNSNIAMICKGLKEFNGDISYFSPEMYNTLRLLDFETSDNSTTLK